MLGLKDEVSCGRSMATIDTAVGSRAESLEAASKCLPGKVPRQFLEIGCGSACKKDPVSGVIGV